MASHIGKLPIAIPSDVTVTLNGSHVSVKGPKGEDSCEVPEGISVKIDDNQVVVSELNEEDETNAKYGLVRSLIASLIEGTEKGFTKNLEIIGTGYRVAAKGTGLNFSLGFSHPVEIAAPEGITFKVTDNTHLSVSGIDKQKVGEVAAQIRRLRPPEPYKGKGIRYVGEHVRRKAGKAGK